ncbi:hypothetical protein BH10CYA1_BH10CYA1_14420 [soil metagenome]
MHVIAKLKALGLNEDAALECLKFVKNELSSLTDYVSAKDDQSIADDLVRAIAVHATRQPVLQIFKDSPREDALKILFIGNSLTFENNLPSVIAQLLVSGSTITSGKHQEESRPLKVYMVVQGGVTLEDHWKYETACLVLTQKGPWDYVVLQEQSVRPLEDPAKMFEYGSLLATEIKKAGAKILIYATWPMSDRLDSLGQLNSAFQNFASKVDAVIVPAGNCWAQASKKNRSLKLYNDLIHPTQAGTYLAASAFYAVLTGTSPVGLPETLFDNDNVPFIKLSRKNALELQQIAWETVSTRSA